MNLQQILDEARQRRARGKEMFESHNEDVCMLCHAEGPDKRSLFIHCFYEMSEIVPEMIDLSETGLKNRGYYLRICKNCRGELLGRMGEWREAMIARRDVRKDSDGEDLFYDEELIPYRENGRIVMLTEEEWKAKRGGEDE